MAGRSGPQDLSALDFTVGSPVLESLDELELIIATNGAFDLSELEFDRSHKPVVEQPIGNSSGMVTTGSLEAFVKIMGVAKCRNTIMHISRQI